MMGERPKFKDRGRSQLAYSGNAKEEMLLNKQLRILESMKKQAENSVTQDQRILYNRFTMKLRRSEVAHARLHGNQELIKWLSRSLFPSLHTVVTDGSEKAVRVILQNAEASRAISAPCRIQTHLAPVSIAKNPTYDDLQGKEAQFMGQQKPLRATEEINPQKGAWKRSTSDDKRVPVSEERIAFREPGSVFTHRRPYTTNHQKSDSLSKVNSRYQALFGNILSQPQDPVPQATAPSVSSFPEELAAKASQESHLEQKCKSSKSKRRLKWTPNARKLFLGLDNTPSGMYHSLDNHTAVNDHNLLNKKVKLFIQKVTALKQEQGCPLQDYYSERLLEKLGRKCQANHDFLCNTEQEQSKWNPVGPETNHRSITIKKLDRNFMGNDTSLEILIWECYNEILTKENLMERNWPDNHPYQLITNSGLESVAS